MAHPREEVEAAGHRYLDVRARVEAGETDFTELADLFTPDAVYIDPAWGRIQGAENIRAFMHDSMVGLDDWEFPVEFMAIDGDHVMVKWTQILPGTRPEGGRYTQSGYSHLLYAGDGRFSYNEDILNMTHVMEDLTASGWSPSKGFNFPPREPNRDWSIPT